MATTFHLFDPMRQDILDETSAVDFKYSGTPANDVMHIMLAKATFTFDQNVDVLVSDLAAFTEVSGDNYTAGGNAVDNADVTMDSAGLITVDGDDPDTWLQHATGFADAIRAILVMKNAGASSTWPLIGYSDAFTAAGNVAGDFTVQLNAAGIFTSAR